MANWQAARKAARAVEAVMAPAPVKLAYLIDFDGLTRPGDLPKFKPGRGNAGWTVAEFPTAAERAAFMAAHPESRMPSWSRIDGN